MRKYSLRASPDHANIEDAWADLVPFLEWAKPEREDNVTLRLQGACDTVLHAIVYAVVRARFHRGDRASKTFVACPLLWTWLTALYARSGEESCCVI